MGTISVAVPSGHQAPTGDGLIFTAVIAAPIIACTLAPDGRQRPGVLVRIVDINLTGITVETVGEGQGMRPALPGERGVQTTI